MADYGKVVIGEPVDETEAPLISAGLPYHNDIETAAPPHQWRPPRPMPPPPGVYGTYPPPPPPPMFFVEPGEECAELACWFSWIPVVGIVNCIMNSDAAPHSRRHYFAQMSCIVATVVIVVNIVFWISWYETANDDCFRRHGTFC